MEPLLSPEWYRVARMRPRLRPGVRISEQKVRGETWFLFSDPISGKHHYFNSAAHRLISACNGESSLNDIWERLAATSGVDTPTQGEALRLLAQAFQANVLTGDVAPNASVIVKSQVRSQSQRTRAATNPLSFKVPLWDPNDFLNAHIDRWRWLFHQRWVPVLAVLLGLGLLLLLVNAPEYASYANHAFNSSRTLLIMWLAYPLIKGLHEMAHAMAVKAFGGEVHEIGVTLLMLTPIPYVDASASLGFASKLQRTAVAGAGIAVELILATASLGLWLLLEPGLLKDVAFAVVLIAGTSTLAINGNPLLRFDGYHMLCDYFELPNLARRSSAYWQHLLQRKVLQIAGPPFDGHARGALPWLMAYAPLSWLYRAVLLIVMSIWLADYNSLLGLCGLALTLWLCLVQPAFKMVRYMASSPELHGQRVRAALLSVAGAAALGSVVFGVELPDRTRAPGVVWLHEDAIVRLATEGFVEEFLAADGDMVVQGQPLIRLSNDVLQAQLEGVKAQLARREIERASHFGADALQASLADGESALLQAEHQRLLERSEQLTVRAGASGRLVVSPRLNILGRYLPQGKLVAHILSTTEPMVRTLVSNENVSQVRDNVSSIEVTLAHTPGVQAKGALVAGVPLASHVLPSAALGESAGGSITLDTSDQSGLTSLEPFFQVDLRLDKHVDARVGSRAWVTFHHANASAAAMVSRFVRRSFLRYFEK